MREIKFRGKVKFNGNHKYSGDWIYGYYRNNENGNALITETLDEMENYIFDETEVDENTVGQYTGLKDKNGTEIYEGDILKIRTVTIKQVVGYVEYGSNYCEYRVFTKNNGYVNLWKQLDIEVIGNVWDNPELLKAGD